VLISLALLFCTHYLDIKEKSDVPTLNFSYRFLAASQPRPQVEACAHMVSRWPSTWLCYSV